LNVSRLNAENVVNPPSTPTITNARASPATSARPSVLVSPAAMPIASEPATLTMSVPHGKVVPKARTARPEMPKRATLPSAPPSATQR
jgi:hypothetical protein